MPHVKYLLSRVSVTEAGSENGSSGSHNGNLRQRQLQSAVASNGKPHPLPKASTSTDNVSCFKTNKLGIGYIILVTSLNIVFGNL